MTQTQIKDAIKSAISDAQIEIEDTTGTNDHFDLMVSSNQIQSLSRLERHRKVLDALNPLMESNGGPVHAVAIKTQPLPKEE
jgi:stress-induced morphogen